MNASPNLNKPSNVLVRCRGWEAENLFCVVLESALEIEALAEQKSRSEVQIYLIIKIINTKTLFQCFVIGRNN